MNVIETIDRETSHNIPIRVVNAKGKDISQKKVILRAGDLASSGYYGTVNVDERKLEEFAELMKTRVEVKIKPGALHTLAAKLTGSTATERIRTFDKEWTLRRIPTYVAKAIFPPGTNFEELDRRTEAYRKEHPELF